MSFCELWWSLLLIFTQCIYSQQWMRLALVSGDVHNRYFCENYQFWTETQRKLCMNHEELIPKVAVGAELAYRECAHQFRWRRWNCSTKARTLLWSNQRKETPTLFGNELILGSREAAFINALFSAGVVHAVTKACSSNLLASCSCEQGNIETMKYLKHTQAYQWNQCDDNIRFGINFSKQFIDSVELNWSYERMYSSHARSLMNLHNNEVGRKTIEANMWRKCRCHGVSGSCTTKVCSSEIPAFRYIGNLLNDKFDTAIKVRLQYISTRQVLMPENLYGPSVTNRQLVYLKNSPLYCRNVTGRRCRLDSTKAGSCENMCCGRGHRTKEREITKNCKCRFIWCCRVTCQKCRYKQKIHICK